MVIEDDRDIRESLTELLEESGYLVSTASNGQEGLDVLRSNALPDVILLDLMMHIKDGFTFRAEQLKDPAISKVPVILMSADGHVQEKTGRTACDAYIKKPLEIDEFLKVIEDQLQKSV